MNLRHTRTVLGTALGRPRRWRYLEQLPKHGIGAEIGVFRGGFTPHLIQVARPRKLHLIDGWWKLWGEHYPDWGAYTDHGRLPTRQAYDEVVKRTQGAPVTIHVDDDLAVLPTFPDCFFDWVYLDSSHQYEHSMQELEILGRKVRTLIMGDDWREDPNASDPNAGCARAVHDFCAQSGWRLLEPDHDFLQWAIVPPSDRR